MSREEILSLMDRARRSLRSARNLLGDGDHDFAISRACYAMFYAASAALLSEDIRRSKHSGFISTFGQRLVRAGVFAVDHQKALQSAFEDRSEGDSAGAFPSRQAVEQRLQEADSLVEAVSPFLAQKGILP